MSEELAELYDDLNLEKLRAKRPSKLIFFCGGVISPPESKRSQSLRDYLYRVHSIQKKLDGKIVLAEKANQLYRETTYGDLISFEEDVARIAAVVLVIAESPGSLAELGAFATNHTISRTLRIVMQEKFANIESFIRFGPVERIKKADRGFVGFYPWQLDGKGQIIIKTAKPHVPYIIEFINEHTKATSATVAFRNLGDSKQFFVFYWVVYLSVAVSLGVLFQYLSRIYPQLEISDLRNRLYCLELAGWISKISYSGKDYYFALSDDDPFDYSFKSNVRQKDTLRRKTIVAASMKKIEMPPTHVRTTVLRRRGEAS